jgi:hypothetical protein
MAASVPTVAAVMLKSFDRPKIVEALELFGVRAAPAQTKVCGGERSRLCLRQGRFRPLGLNSREHQRRHARVGGAEEHGNALVDMVAAGAFHRAALTVDGAIWTCGSGDQGQLGHGDEQDRLRPM